MAPKSTRMLHAVLAATSPCVATRLSESAFRLQALLAVCLDPKHVAARNLYLVKRLRCIVDATPHMTGEAFGALVLCLLPCDCP